ncbi:MAG: hypothetical protein K9W43_09905 [Candidatus Thorarchaeota archaeon]|nr:hypothetical protein [Candidatus Thorarchaeota archaeon]
MSTTAWSAIRKSPFQRLFEHYKGSDFTMLVKTPFDIWWVDTGGLTEFPIFVKVVANQIAGSWGWHYEPRVCFIDVYVTDVSEHAPISWITIAEPYVHLADLYTNCTAIGHSNVTGNYGDNENYTGGSEIRDTWSGQTTRLVMKSWNSADDLDSQYYHIGQLQIVCNTGGINETDFITTLKLWIPNQIAKNHNYDLLHFKLVVTVCWKAYWYSFGFADRELTQNQTLVIGDGQPSSDATLYLLQAEDYTVVL